MRPDNALNTHDRAFRADFGYADILRRAAIAQAVTSRSTRLRAMPGPSRSWRVPPARGRRARQSCSGRACRAGPARPNLAGWPRPRSLRAFARVTGNATRPKPSTSGLRSSGRAVTSTLNAAYASPRNVLASRSRAAVTIAGSSPESAALPEVAVGHAGRGVRVGDQAEFGAAGEQWVVGEYPDGVAERARTA